MSEPTGDTRSPRSAPLPAAVAGFLAAAQDTLAATFEREAAHLTTASAWMADAVASDGLIRVFATGHSRLLAEEIFYRAGGLAPVDAILEDTVSGYREVTKSELTERLEGLGEIVVAHHRLAPPDVLLVISQSGRNGVPIEVAQAARRRGLRTIAITSLLHAAGQPSRHSSGLHLNDVVDLVIDNGCPNGDCAVTISNGMLMGPLSTVVGAALCQALVIGAAEELVARGIEPPVFRSGNVDGGREWSQRLIDRYWDRIRGW